MGLIFDRSLGRIEKNKERVELGLSNCIPFPFERFSDAVPGIEQEKYTIISASSGVGKSKFVKYLYVINAFEQWRKNRNAFNLKIFYFCLEESKESFMNSIISYRLFTRYGLLVDQKELNSTKYAIPDEVLAYIAQEKPYFDEFEEKVEIIDDLHYPYSILLKVKEYAEANGTWSYVPYKHEGVMKKKKDHFTWSFPNMYLITVVDHINLLHPESKMSLHESLTRFSSQYCLELRDKFRASVVLVQQQAAAKEELTFNLFGGKNIDVKLEPSLDGLGDNKLTQRDANLVLGLFGPARYPIKDHRGYDVTRMGDGYRSLIVLKNREGPPNDRIGLHFLGAVGAFAELPKAGNMDDAMYDNIMRNHSLFNNG